MMKKVSGFQSLAANIQFIENSVLPRSVLLNLRRGSHHTWRRYSCMEYDCEGREGEREEVAEVCEDEEGEEKQGESCMDCEGA